MTPPTAGMIINVVCQSVKAQHVGKSGGHYRSAHPSGRLLDTHCPSQAFPEPSGYGGGDVDHKQGLGYPQDEAVIEVQLPYTANPAQEEHTYHIQEYPHQHGPPCAIPVPNPAGYRRQDSAYHTSQEVGEGYSSQGPAQVLLKLDHQDGKGLANEARSDLKDGSNGNYEPSVVVIFLVVFPNRSHLFTQPEAHYPYLFASPTPPR